MWAERVSALLEKHLMSRLTPFLLTSVCVCCSQERQVFQHSLAGHSMYHYVMETVSDFWLAPEVPLVQGVHLDPIWLEFEIGMLLSACPPKILTPRTPGMSLGTKNFSSKFFSYHKNKMLFYAFCGFVVKKMPKIAKIRSFWPNLYVIAKSWENDLFFCNFRHLLHSKSTKCIK